jgi:hypothetical protein
VVIAISALAPHSVSTFDVVDRRHPREFPYKN